MRHTERNSSKQFTASTKDTISNITFSCMLHSTDGNYNNHKCKCTWNKKSLLDM